VPVNFLHPDYAANVDFWSRARAVMSGEDAVDEVIGIASQPRSHNLFASRTRATLISCQVNQLAAIATGRGKFDRVTDYWSLFTCSSGHLPCCIIQVKYFYFLAQ
jgi:hypothetical protein